MSLISCLRSAARSVPARELSVGALLTAALMIAPAHALQGKTPTGGAPHPILRDKTPVATPPVHSRNGSGSSIK